MMRLHKGGCGAITFDKLPAAIFRYGMRTALIENGYPCGWLKLTPGKPTSTDIENARPSIEEDRKSTSELFGSRGPETPHEKTVDCMY
jgi:hypothetical protein